MSLKAKIDHAIESLQKFEGSALKYKDYGYHLKFMMEPDYDVVYELCKMSKVHFRAFYNVKVKNAVVVTAIRSKERKELEATCNCGRDNIYLNPIVDWSKADVNEFLKRKR